MEYTRDTVDHYTLVKEEAEFPYQYPVDTVSESGEVDTTFVSYSGAGSLGTMEGKEAALELIRQMKVLNVIGVGVTEAGLSSEQTPVMQDLAMILKECQICMEKGSLKCCYPKGKLCIINTDNVPSKLLKESKCRVTLFF